MSALYRKLLNAATGAKHRKLEEEQMAWLKKRNHECKPYKWHEQCLLDMYEERIDRLKKERE